MESIERPGVDIWKTDGRSKTGREAILEFVKTYWADTRSVKTVHGDGTFTLRGGIATYLLVNTDPRWWIVRRLDA